MIKNYFKTAWRNIIKHRFYSIVNVLGLFAGIAFTLLIGAYVWSEVQVNRNLRQASYQYFLKSGSESDVTTLGPLAKTLKEQYPHLVKNYYRWDGITSVASKGDKNFREGIQLGDSTLLSMYGFSLLSGDAKTALLNPFSVVITKEIAQKYFAKMDVVGETIAIQSFSGSKHDFVITGVLNDMPDNSVTHLNEDNNNTFFIPVNTYAYFGRNDFDSWSNLYIPSYIELQPNVSVQAVQMAIDKLVQQNAPDFIKSSFKVEPVLLTYYYLQKNNGLVKRMLYTLSFSGLFILMMAIVNFINMAVSSSSARVREIGVRKVMGGIRRQIIFQFLAESFLLVLIATLLAFMVYPIMRPFFQQLIGKSVPALSAFPIYFIGIPALFVAVIGLLAGLYPAFVLSAVKSADAVKGKLKSVKEAVLLRKSLVGFQFCIAIVVMVAALIITRQMDRFFDGQMLGYNKEFVVSSQVPRDWTPAGVLKMQTIRNEFATLPQVSSASLSYEIPNGNNGVDLPVYKLGEDSAKASSMQLLVADEKYTGTYQIPIKAGNFLTDNGSDSGKIVMNEKAIAALGFADAAAAVGQQVRIAGDPTILTIKGVISDFHFGSMQQNIAPLFFFNVQFVPNYRFLSFKMKPGNITASIQAIQKKWSVLMPGSSFEYQFMDDTLKRLYATELQLKKAAYTATVLSLVIVLLGVLGLISLSIHKRVKEISVRKVLGASVPGVIMIFVKDFMLVVIVAALIACPVAYYIMHAWLTNYASRVSITAAQFFWPVIALALVTLVLIALQTLRAAMANPMKNLSSE